MILTSDHKRKFHEMLMLFTQNTPNTRSRLRRKYSDELIDEAVRLGYIVEDHKTEDGIAVYRITESGRILRDR